jgi:hypothetical protein
MNYHAVQLENDSLRVECYPEHGFVIGSIRLADDPRNILWNPSSVSFAPLSTTDLGPAGEESIDSFDLHVLAGGWFLMFPTAGTPGNSTEYWMHGEAPRLAWNVVSSSSTELVCQLSTPVSGFQIERSVCLAGSSVIVNTTATNNSGVVQEITFGEHPCFDRAVFRGGAVVTQPIHSETASVADPDNSTLIGGREFLWPQAPSKTGGTTNLSAIPHQADGRHDHVSIRSAAPVLLAGAEIEIELDWDTGSMPYALLWQHFAPNGSPWGGDVFAVEPSSSAGRTLTEAKASLSTTSIDADESIAFWMTVQVNAGGSSQ